MSTLEWSAVSRTRLAAQITLLHRNLEPIDFLPLVNAYPALGKTYGEVSCIAGVRTDGDPAPEWIRLYRVTFRALQHEQQLAKYPPIRLQVEASPQTRTRAAQGCARADG